MSKDDKRIPPKLLDYAAGRFPPRRDRRPYSFPFILATVGTLVSYSSIGLAAWYCIAAINRAREMEGGTLTLWDNADKYENRVVNAPLIAGLAWILVAASIFTILLTRRRAHPAITVIFVLLNLFTILLLFLALDQVTSSYNFYP